MKSEIYNWYLEVIRWPKECIFFSKRKVKWYSTEIVFKKIELISFQTC